MSEAAEHYEIICFYVGRTLSVTQPQVLNRQVFNKQKWLRLCNLSVWEEWKEGERESCAMSVFASPHTCTVDYANGNNSEITALSNLSVGETKKTTDPSVLNCSEILLSLEKKLVMIYICCTLTSVLFKKAPRSFLLIKCCHWISHHPSNLLHMEARKVCRWATFVPLRAKWKVENRSFFSSSSCKLITRPVRAEALQYKNRLCLHNSFKSSVSYNA